ncbi:sensor histidine kinase [Salmonirosea aquatica]|uniref:histidine kinase n=1 Tax=Salmonirosea aquatica TaxID=2654236 RepID=A0A7C9FRI6_9BACT|nr:PAS domain-containing protein [Cytophagaceae bacterium SJW1-29]
MNTFKTYEQLVKENEDLREQLEEAAETIDAIRTGQVDAIVVKGPNEEHQLYTLKTADQNYRVFIEKMNEGAVTLNEQGLIVYCNTMFASVVGLPLSKIIGLHFELLIPADCLETYRNIFKRGWSEDCKTEISILNGTTRVPCQLSVTTLLLDEGSALSVIITDLTFQKEIQHLLKQNNRKLEIINAELETSNHDLQQFASVASHDLQEPLRKILIFSTLLRDKHKHEFSTESATYLDKIIASSERMRSMIVDILGYSRLSTNVSPFTLTNLREVVNEVIEDYEILIKEKKATILVQNLPEIEANRGQMKQVFQNLISNSIKFSKPNNAPVITITGGGPDHNQPSPESTPQTPTCCITISDNGIGFNDQYRDKIFSLFERLNTKDKYEGSGIGLAITKKIIDKHNGTIRATSQEGQGSQFMITLPLRQKSA